MKTPGAAAAGAPPAGGGVHAPSPGSRPAGTRVPPGPSRFPQIRRGLGAVRAQSCLPPSLSGVRGKYLRPKRPAAPSQMDAGCSYGRHTCPGKWRGHSVGPSRKRADPAHWPRTGVSAGPAAPLLPSVVFCPCLGGRGARLAFVELSVPESWVARRPTKVQPHVPGRRAGLHFPVSSAGGGHMIQLSQWNERGSAVRLGPPTAVRSPPQPLSGEEANEMQSHKNWKK